MAEARGHGIGTECLRRLLRRADAAGLDVALQVVQRNPAQRLYERLAFRPVDADDVRLAMRRKPARDTHPCEEMPHEQA
jgi:GNAT superfamily N-acetyltransferase